MKTLCLAIFYGLLFTLAQAQEKKNNEKLVPYRIGDSWGFADIKGNLRIPVQFEEVDFFLQDLAKVKQKGLWGLIDKKGNTFLPCAYSIVYGAGKASRVVVCKGGDKNGHGGLWGFLPAYKPQESEFDLAYDLIRESGGQGVLGILQKGRWGAIDSRGKLRIPAMYEVGYTAHHTFSLEIPQTTTLPTEQQEKNAYLKLRFENHLARVSRDKLWGYINETGIEVIKVQYPFVGDFAEDMVAVVGDTPTGLRLGFLNTYGDTLVPIVYDVREGVYQKTKFQDGLALVGKGGKLGYVGKDTKPKINFEYAQAYNFSEGRAWVSYDYQSINPTWKMIDSDGKLIYTLPADCQLIDTGFEQGFVRVRRAGKENFLNRRGEFLLKTWTDHLDTFQDDLAMVATAQGDSLKMGFIDTGGNWIIKPLYDYAPLQKNFQRVQQFIRLRRAGKFGILDSKGREVVPFAYEGLEMPFYLPTRDLYGSENRLSAKLNGKWGYLNPKNEWAITPQYEEARPFYEGLAKVKHEGKWGFINTENKRFWR